MPKIVTHKAAQPIIPGQLVGTATGFNIETTSLRGLNAGRRLIARYGTVHTVMPLYISTGIDLTPRQHPIGIALNAAKRPGQIVNILVQGSMGMRDFKTGQIEAVNTNEPIAVSFKPDAVANITLTFTPWPEGTISPLNLDAALQSKLQGMSAQQRRELFEGKFIPPDDPDAE